MGRIEKMKRELIEESNKRILGEESINEDRAFSLGFGNQGGLTLTEDSESEKDYKRYLNQYVGGLVLRLYCFS